MFPTLQRARTRLDLNGVNAGLAALDWLGVGLAAECAAGWGAGVSVLQLSLGAAGAFIVTAASLKAGLWLTGAYQRHVTQADRSLGGLALGAMLAIAGANVLAPDAQSAAALAATVPLAALLLAGLHYAVALWTRAARRNGACAERVVVVGATEAARRLVKAAAGSEDFDIVAVVDDRSARAPKSVAGAPVAGTIEDLLGWEGLGYVDRVIVAVTHQAEQRVRAILAKLSRIPNRIDLLLDYDVRGVSGKRVASIAHAPLARISETPSRGRVIGRCLDVVISAALLLALAPAFALIALIVRLSSRGPVLFRQYRRGFNGAPFALLKFRTMRHRPGAPYAPAKHNDPRITRAGRLLRAFGLDDLPQLWNVLRGDMSLVGPRPHAIDMRLGARSPADVVANYAHRYRVRPGLISWAQIKTAHAPVTTPACLKRRVRLDLDYIAQASLWFDLRVLAAAIGRAFGVKPRA